MSDENVPKLRLKPKLVTDPVVAQQTPAKADAPPVEPAPGTPPTAEPEAPKLGRLKPKLVVAPVQEATPTPEPAPTPTPAPAPAPAPAAESATVPEAAVAKPAVKFGFKPRAAVAAQPVAPVAADPSGSMPPPAAVEPAAPNAPALPTMGVTVSTGQVTPPEPAAASKAAGMAFPPPPGAKGGKFPPPQGVKKALPPAGGAVSKAPVGKTKFTLPKKKIVVMAGAGLAVLVLLGGGFIVYQNLTKEPPPQPKPKLAAKPDAPQGQVVVPAGAVADPAKPQQTASPNEAAGAAAAGTEGKPVEPKATEPAVAVVPEPTVPVEVKPVAPPPPPKPSVAFRGWVENLKIRGVRGGANPRVFIGASSYQQGDLVNPQMGITFEGYSDATRLLVFKDKTGAKVERRN